MKDGETEFDEGSGHLVEVKWPPEKLPPIRHIETTLENGEKFLECPKCHAVFGHIPTCPLCGATDLTIGSADRDEIENPPKAPE